MTTILRIDCSPRQAEAHSWRIADELMQKLTHGYPDAHVLRLALSDWPPAFVDHDFARTMGTHTTPDRAATVPALALSERLIAEVEACDVLVIATPMHNYTVPAVLKAWIDQVVRVGRTFKGTPGGKVGTLADRPCYIVISSGGYFEGDKARQPDHLTPYLRDILATIGIRDITFIKAQGLTRGDEAMAEAYRTARAQIAGLTLPDLPARA